MEFTEGGVDTLPSQVTAEERVLLAAACDVNAALTLHRMMQATPIRLSPRNAAVAEAIAAVLRGSRNRLVSPALVAERMTEPPLWLEMPSDEVVASARISFEHDLVFLGERAQAQMATVVAEKAGDDLKGLGTISPDARRAFRELAALPDAALVVSRRPTNYQDVVERRKDVRDRIFFGLRPLDRALSPDAGSRQPGHYQPGNLLVVGAETGVGKTSFSTEVALRGTLLYNRIFNAQREALLYSAEQTAEDLVELAGLTKGGRWRDAFDQMGSAVHFVDRTDYGHASVESVVAHLVTHVHSHVRIGRNAGWSPEKIAATLPLIVVVDYAKLFADRHLPTVQGIEQVAATLKTEVALGGAFDASTFPELAGFGPAVILPTQVKRPKVMPKADREEWRPDLDDLADCRGIVDFADIVVLLWRDAATEVAEVKLAKVRRSRRGASWLEVGFAGGRWYGDGNERTAGFESEARRYEAAIRAEG
jgi:hypothetical protein